MNDFEKNNLNIKSLCDAILLLETSEDVYAFFKDLCTPTELSALAERWQICISLSKGLSYREIQKQTGASLTTIGRVARFLKDEPYQGYTRLLKKTIL